MTSECIDCSECNDWGECNDLLSVMTVVSITTNEFNDLLSVMTVVSIIVLSVMTGECKCDDYCV
jgi:hypothetical protein